MHLEGFIYGISFFIFAIGMVFLLKRRLTDFVEQKKKSFADFFSTAHYLQNISLNSLMHEKEEDVNVVLKKIRQKTKEEILSMEQKSAAEIKDYIHKLKSEFAYRMKITNSKFINETKEKIVLQLMDRVKNNFR